MNLLVLVLTGLVASTQGQICGSLCDGDDAGRASNPRELHSESLFGRQITILISDDNNVGFARISNGDPGDEAWVDRSFNGGRDWQGRIANAVIGANSRQAQTGVINVDGNLAGRQIGVLRACGKAGDRTEIVCTPWYRSSHHAENAAAAAGTALMMFYKDDGLFDTTGWWNAANCITALIDFMKITGDRTYMFAVESTFEKNKGNNFCNDYLDDTGWWGLAWIGAFDLTGDRKYLDMAARTTDCMRDYIDNKCGGGVYWSFARDYKNAITNELFIKLAAAVHNRMGGNTPYLALAQQVWQWFDASGMINRENLINDGLNTQGDCKNNNAITWTYNQGVILGALVELFKATGDQNYLNKARTIANAATASTYLNNNGILHEPCDHDRIDCGGDAPSFKGVFARNIGELNAALSDKPYSNYIRQNGDAIQRNGNSFAEYGLHYEGPFEFFTAASQHSAFDMLNAQERVNRGS